MVIPLRQFHVDGNSSCIAHSAARSHCHARATQPAGASTPLAPIAPNSLLREAWNGRSQLLFGRSYYHTMPLISPKSRLLTGLLYVDLRSYIISSVAETSDLTHAPRV